MGAIRNRNVTKIDSTYMKQQQVNEIIKNKRKKYLIRRLTAFAIVAAALLYFMISTIISQFDTIKEMKNEQAKLSEQLEQLKQEEIILKEEIVKLNDDEYIGKLARKEYFLSDDGEIIFSIPDE